MNSIADVVDVQTQARNKTPIEVIRAKYISERIKVPVPAWDGVVLYFPKLSSRAAERTDASNEKSEYERQIQFIIDNAQVADGSPAFVPEDFGDLMDKAALEVVNKVVTDAMGGGLTSKEADALLAHDPFSDSKSSSPNNSTSSSGKLERSTSTNSPSGQPTIGARAKSRG